jgi:predicted DCC family thiol-disulfide oxidoreductase YuxK
MKNKILIYDDNCPLCSWYSHEFVRFGFLPENGRTAFSTLDPVLLDKIDFEKSRNEIPLLDTKTGKVLYGIDTLLEIAGTKIPFIKKTGNIPLVKWFLKRLYKLISYNRKVIVASKCGPGSIDCTPDMNYFYRLIFMAVFLLFNTAMLTPLHNYVFTNLSYYHPSVIGLQAVHFIFVFINCILAFTLTKEKGFEYLGQVNMLALTTILLLLPLLILNLFYTNEWINSFYLLFSAVFIFKEYIRRMDFAGLLIKNKWLVSLNLLSLTGFLFYLFHYSS